LGETDDVAAELGKESQRRPALKALQRYWNGRGMSPSKRTLRSLNATVAFSRNSGVDAFPDFAMAANGGFSGLNRSIQRLGWMSAQGRPLEPFDMGERALQRCIRWPR
jgi:hypothetical protein